VTTDRAPLIEFGRYLRAEGLPVGTGRILAFCDAAGVLSVSVGASRRSEQASRDRLYWAGRTTLVSHPTHIVRYDELFTRYFGRGAVGDALSSIGSGLAPPDEAPEGPGGRGEGGETIALGHATDAEGAEGHAAVPAIASSAESLRAKSFEELSDAERAAARALLARLRVALPARRTRRLRPDRAGRHFDLRRTLRSSLRTHGEPFHKATRGRRTGRRGLVLVLDISGSMGPYSRALMQFGYAAMGAGRRVDVFCFGTRLTNVTRPLRATDPDTALARASQAVEDWEGGTRIGESLKELLDGYSSSASVRGAVVVICSDGLERGDPELLGAQMARLSRLAHRVVWVNPLKGSPLYSPLARGMNAALPHIDEFVPGHNVASLESLAATLSGGRLP
jgi:uncharacterized protein